MFDLNLIGIFLLLLFGFSLQQDKLKNIRKLTNSGKHFHPRFSADNRYIYYSAYAGSYGKECKDIYRLDLNYLDKVDDPSRISRISTGIGYADWAAPSSITDSNDLYFESDFEAKLKYGQSKVFKSDDHMCPVSRCQGDDQPVTCSPGFHQEQFKDTYIYNAPLLKRRQKKMIFTENINFTPYQIDSFLAYTKRCFVQSSSSEQLHSTCLVINEKEPIDEHPNHPVYFDYFSAAKDSTNKINYVYQKVDYTSELKDFYVFPLAQAKIMTGELTSDGLFKDERSLDACETGTTNKAALWPRLYTTSTQSGILYTTITADSKQALKACYSDGKTEIITDINFNSMQADVRSDNKQIVFIRQPSSETDYQLYLADVESSVEMKFNKKSLDVVNDVVNDYITLLKKYEFQGELGRVRVEEFSSNIYYEHNTNINDDLKCKQLYHLDLQYNDFSSPRLISTGLSNVDSFDFYDSNKKRKIVYSGDFMKPSKDDDASKVHKCNPVGCDDPKASDKLKTWCQGKLTKYLGKDYDIFISNIYGNIEKRVTNNLMYEGDVTFHQETGRIFYTKFNSDRIDIAYRELTDLSKEIIVTGKLADGYYGGVSIIDSNTILYHATKPGYNKNSEFRTYLADYQVVDISNLGIYIYKFDDDKDTLLSTLSESNQYPIYNQEDSMILFESYSNNNWKKSKIYRTAIDSNVELILDTKPKNSRTASFASKDTTQIVFVSDGSTSNSNVLHLASYNVKKPLTKAPTQPPRKTNPPTTTTKVSTTTTVRSVLDNTTNNSMHNKIANFLLIFCFLFISLKYFS